MSNETEIAFSKMNGLGNSFVVIDAREHPLSLSGEDVRALADASNETTKGCDQVLVIHPSREGNEKAVFMQIFNADGGEVEACGNGARAVAAFLGRNGRPEVTLETLGGNLLCQSVEAGGSTSTAHITMPPPKFGWRDIPLAQEHEDTEKVRLLSDLPLAFMVNVGNPHAVMFVTEDKDVDEMAREYGAALECDPRFPERANITFARIDENGIHIATWERGAGLTLACGTAACAVGIAAFKRQKYQAPGQGQFIIYPPFSRKRESAHVRAAALQRLLVGFGAESELTLAGLVEFEFSGELTL